MAEARLSDGQRLLAVNDLFLGPRRHATAAYVLQHGDRTEAQWSSGLIVSTGLGATGWLGSILDGAAALGGALGQDLDPRPLTEGLTWGSRYLLFAVRVPYAGTAGRTVLVYGRVDARTPLVLESRMAEEGDRPAFSLGYGLCFGHNETKAIAMAVLDRALSGPASAAPSEDQEFVLTHVDGLESMGFCTH